jgi:MYXO-CTERM domain-containing protein
MMRALLPCLVTTAILHSGVAAADYPFCNADAVCAWPETCSTCPMECGSCDVTTRTRQTPKYVDQACPNHGDGLVDSCASGEGQPGRFNDLQAAIATLTAGDTLFIHPGDYFRAGGAFGPGDDGVHGQPDAPIILTAADPANPPTIHSWDPAAPNDATSHVAMSFGGEDVILDHLRIEGVAMIFGTRMQIQYSECTRGWEVCDGNWSCMRAEWCTDCRIHHNNVHDVVDSTGKCDGSTFEPREAGFKEFNGERNIWEFNTVVNAARWGYDLHRNSVDTTVRFNHFQGFGSWAINIERSTNNYIYGNIIVGAAGCTEIGGLNELEPGQPHHDLIHHNTCIDSGSGFHLSGEIEVELNDNITGAMAPGGSENVNVSLPGAGQISDCNGWDASSWFSNELYETYFHSLGEWQTGTGHDANSIAAPGGACTFVDPPSAADDLEFDLHTTGECATLACDGGEAGPYGITPCVGHTCGDVPSSGSGGSGGAGGGGSAGAPGTGTGPGSGGAAASGDEPASGGCSCMTARASRDPGAWVLLLGLALAWRRRARLRR